MAAMAKVILLLLVVFMATAVENSEETHSDLDLDFYSSPELTHASFPPPPSPTASLLPQEDEIITPRLTCLKNCNITCESREKTPFLVRLCVGVCATSCPPHPLHLLNCPLDCAQSSSNSLRHDASMVDELVSSCYKKCKRE